MRLQEDASEAGRVSRVNGQSRTWNRKIPAAAPTARPVSCHAQLNTVSPTTNPVSCSPVTTSQIRIVPSSPPVAT